MPSERASISTFDPEEAENVRSATRAEIVACYNALKEVAPTKAEAVRNPTQGDLRDAGLPPSASQLRLARHLLKGEDIDRAREVQDKFGRLRF